MIGTRRQTLWLLRRADVPLVLFKAEKGDDKTEYADECRWSLLVPRLTIVDVPGNRHGMFDAPRSRELRERLCSQLPVPDARGQPSDAAP